MDKDERGDLKKLILKFVKGCDLKIEDVVLDEEEELISGELEELIESGGIDNEGKGEMVRKGKMRNRELRLKDKVGEKV